MLIANYMQQLPEIKPVFNGTDIILLIAAMVMTTILFAEFQRWREGKKTKRW